MRASALITVTSIIATFGWSDAGRFSRALYRDHLEILRGVFSSDDRCGPVAVPSVAVESQRDSDLCIRCGFG